MNFYRHNGVPYNPEEYYANTYSLWQNSQYYDTSNLSPQKHWGEGSGTCPCDTEEPIMEVRDSMNRKLVTRESLFRDPELFNRQNNIPQPQPVVPSAGYDWTQQSWPAWQKATDVSNAPLRNRQQTRGKRLQMLKNVAKRPEMSKAASMMEKMGWDGGALGKSGDGIVEPITANEVYATKTLGLGHESSLKRPKAVNRPQLPKTVKHSKIHFLTNVLRNILQFVKNDKEMELIFEHKLHKHERKHIHSLVNEILNGSELLLSKFDNITQFDIAKDINKHNCYVLTTLSEGDHPKRRICIFKEAPENVYLITPDDLNNEEPEEIISDENTKTVKKDDEETKTVKNDEETKIVKNDEETKIVKNDEETKTVKNDGETKIVKNDEETKIVKNDEETKIVKNDDEEKNDEETNPFLKSITRHLDGDKEPEVDEKRDADLSLHTDIVEQLEECNLEFETDEPILLKKIINYFQEFAEKEEFTDFRFLGEFSIEEVDAITQFMTHVNMCIKKPRDPKDLINKHLLEVFNKNVNFEVYQDSNNATVINKPKKETAS